jgi:N-acetylglucosaminyldiphosphoundecaprenol N-acetyl-beta-D-mannosaminyltransferase
MAGVELDAVTMAEAVLAVRERLASPGVGLAVPVNVDQIVLAHDDRDLRQALDQAFLRTADGTVVVWLAAALGQPLPERVAGIDLMDALLPVAEAEGWPIFLLGAEPGVAAAAADAYRRRWPGLLIAGVHHGFWQDDEGVAREIARSGARLLFLGLSSPRKERFVLRHRHLLGDVGLALGVGGAFDIAAGRTRRAPSWVGTIGVEWAWRLAQEPRRLWRRYLVRDLRIVPLVLADLRERRRRPA